MASHWHSYGSSAELELWTSSRWANGVSDISTKLSSFWEISARNIYHFSYLFVDGRILILRLVIWGTIYGSGDIFLSPSQAHPFARCPTASLSGCGILLPHRPSSQSWTASAPHVCHSILPHVWTFCPVSLVSQIQPPRSVPCATHLVPSHALLLHSLVTSVVPLMPPLLSPIPQFLVSLQILLPHPACCLLPVSPSLPLFHVTLPAYNVKFSMLKQLAHLPSYLPSSTLP